MILRASDGNTARGFRAYSDRGAIAHFLDSIAVGESKTIERFEANKGEMPLTSIQTKISINKAQGTSYQTRTTPEGLLIRRLA